MRCIKRYFESSNETFARFTDRARLVFALAEEFAIEQRSPEISPEHILRGVACGSQGVGRVALKELGIDLARELPAILDLLPPNIVELSPPLNIWPLSSSVYAERTIGSGAAECLRAARRAADAMDHNYLGTEHIVWGLLSHECPAAAFLGERGVSFESARNGIKRVLGIS